MITAKFETSLAPIALDHDEINAAKADMTYRNTSARFTYEGCTFNVVTGWIANDKNANIINKVHYFGLSKEMALTIAELTGTTLHFQDNA